MNNYTMETYEIKREITNFTKKVTKGLNKPTRNFLLDMQFGISSSKNVLVSEIARSLKEDVKLNHTIERLCNNLSNLSEEEVIQIKQNYNNEMKKLIPEEPIVILDDTDIAKRYGKKFEDLDRVIDGSSLKEEIVPGYNVCEAVVLSEKEKQPISLYSKIYSCKSDNFISKNTYTHDSIKTVKNIINRKANYIFDRLYDDNKIYDLIDKNEDYFIVRVQDKRTLLFKGKKRKCSEVANERKGKIIMKLDFSEETKEVLLSHTRVVLPYNKREYTLVIVYGLSETKPMMLLTNRTIKNKKDAIKIVRFYMYRWRVEDYFRAKKQEYKFEDMRVRNLKSMNNLNLMLQIRMGHLAYLGEQVEESILCTKIRYRSNSLKNRVYLWFTQLAKGIKEILSHAKTGIEKYKYKIKRVDHKQLSLKLE